MKARQLMTISIVVFLAGAVFTVCVLVLPYVKTSQTLLSRGPSTPYGNSSYTISGYFLPPVDSGAQISLTLSDFQPNSLSMSLFPSDPNSIAPNGPPLVYDPIVGGPVYHVVVVSTGDQAYGIFVASLNRTGFTLSVQSVWSQFYPLRGYLPAGFFLLLLGAIGIAYFRQARKREQEYERVVSEVRSRQA